MIKNFNAVVVLNGGTNSEGYLYEDTKQRVIKGLEITRNYRINNIIMAGRDASKMKEFALKQRVPESTSLFTEATSRNTIENAHYVKKHYLKPKGWNCIALVTDQFHSKRAKKTFELVLGQDALISSFDSHCIYSAEQQKELLKQERFFMNLTDHLLTEIPPDADQEREKVLAKIKKQSVDYFTLIRK